MKVYLEQGSSTRKDINPNCKRNLVRVEYLLQKIFVSKSLDSKESGPNAFLLHFGCCVLVENRDVFFPLLQCVHFRIYISFIAIDISDQKLGCDNRRTIYQSMQISSKRKSIHSQKQTKLKRKRSELNKGWIHASHNVNTNFYKQYFE